MTRIKGCIEVDRIPQFCGAVCWLEHVQRTIYADLRCLQDVGTRDREIGQHAAALLRTRRRSALSHWQTVGLIDPRLPKFSPDLLSLVDNASSSLNPCSNGAPAVFLETSPMTHDTRFTLRFQNLPGFLRTAAVYDFTPLDRSGYLPSVPSRIEYSAKLARIRSFDLFFPVSEYAASRLSELLGVCRSRIHVTGASARRSLYEHRDRLSSMRSFRNRPDCYFVTMAGDGPRNNTECVVKAVQCLQRTYSRHVSLKAIGNYDDAYKSDLFQLAGHKEGEGFLEVYPDVCDEELVTLLSGSIALIAPSYIESFSLPIVQASICACPAIASSCAAHIELIDNANALYPYDDSVTLSQRLEALLNDPGLRASLVTSQTNLASKFHEDAVGRRFWSVVEAAVENRGAAAVMAKRHKPRLAFLSPYPPDLSDAARYTALTMRAGAQLFHSDIYTDAARPLACAGNFRDGGRVSLAPLIAGTYDGVISVLGNSSLHTRIFEVFERYGGPCIVHDARNLPSQFVEPIIERASPLIVHTRREEAQIRKGYGVHAHVATCCPTVLLNDEDLTPTARNAARERLGIAPDAFLVSAFGRAGRETGMLTSIFAVELLRAWNVPIELFFVGSAGGEKEELDRISTLYGIAEHIHSLTDIADDATYRDFLIASDAAIQLQAYGLRHLSTALVNCIGAGLPCVATSDLAESCDAPAYVLTVPDEFSPLQVAEQIALIWETRTLRTNHSGARAAYLGTHNFEHYAKRLIEIIGMAS